MADWKVCSKCSISGGGQVSRSRSPRRAASATHSVNESRSCRSLSASRQSLRGSGRIAGVVDTQGGGVEYGVSELFGWPLRKLSGINRLSQDA